MKRQTKRSMSVRYTLGLLVAFSLVVGAQPAAVAALSEIDPETGSTTVPCGADGKCNKGACKHDPDCPETGVKTKLPGDVDDLVVLPVEWHNWRPQSVSAKDMGVEGLRYYLNPVYARSLSVTVCKTHFPRGSQGRTNLEAAIAKINATSNIGISMQVIEGPHLKPNQLYASPPVDRYRVEITYKSPFFDDQGNRKPIGATGGVYHYVGDNWNCCTDTAGTASDHAVIAFSAFSSNPDNEDAGGGYQVYSRELCADPLQESPCVVKLSSSDAINYAPSVGVLAHEIAHSFHMGHPYPGSNDRNSHQEYHSPTVHRGGRSIYHGNVGGGADIRTGGISAYTKALQQDLYPPSAVTTDSRPEWYNHEMLIFTDVNGVVTTDTIVPFADHNPTNMYYSALTDEYLDCATDELPVYTMQASDVSNFTPGSDQPKDIAQLFAMKQADGTWGRIAWRQDDVDSSAADYVQFNWTRTLHMTGSSFGIPVSGSPFVRSFRSRIDGFGEYAEANEDDNNVYMTVTLHNAKHECP